MLAPNPTTTRPSVAYPGGYRVWLADNVRCPRCQRELRATDRDLDRLGGVFVCAGCHVDIAHVERR
jgi:hypothetical protein